MHTAEHIPLLRLPPPHMPNTEYCTLQYTLHATSYMIHVTFCSIDAAYCTLQTTYIVAAAKCITYTTYFIQHCTIYISYTHTEPHSIKAGYLILTTLHNMYQIPDTMCSILKQHTMHFKQDLDISIPDSMTMYVLQTTFYRNKRFVKRVRRCQGILHLAHCILRYNLHTPY